MLPIEDCESEVSVDAHPFGARSPDQVHTEHLVGSGKGDGPFLVSASKFLGCDVPFRVPGDTASDNECEDVCVGAVLDSNEAV